MYGDVRFTLGGSCYTARYSNAAWDDAKSSLGVASETECVRLATSPEPFLVLALAGLRHYHPDFNPRVVDRLAHEEPAAGELLLRDAVVKAIDLSLPEPKPEKKRKANEPEKAQNPDPHALRREALKVGLSPSEFSAITPREAAMFIEAYEFKQAQALRAVITTAWYTEAFARTKRLRPLSEILAKEVRIGPLDPKAAAKQRAESALAYFRRAKAAKNSEKGSRAR